MHYMVLLLIIGVVTVIFMFLALMDGSRAWEKRLVKEARAEIQNLQSDNERLLQEARAERDGMLRDARDMADKLVAEAKQTAKDEGERMIDQAKQAIDGERAAAVAELKAEVAKLSLEIAEKLVRQELKDDGAQQELIGRMISDSKLN